MHKEEKLILDKGSWEGREFLVGLQKPAELSRQQAEKGSQGGQPAHQGPPSFPRPSLYLPIPLRPLYFHPSSWPVSLSLTRRMKCLGLT